MNLFEKFKMLDDSRDTRGKKHKLINILIINIYSILCGQADYTNIACFMNKKEYFNKLLNLEMVLYRMTAYNICLLELNLKNL